MEKTVTRITGGVIVVILAFIATSFVAMDIGWVFDELTADNGPPIFMGRVALVAAFFFGVSNIEVGETVLSGLNLTFKKAK